MPLAQIARDSRIVLRTAQRWFQRYRARGLAGARADRGSRTFPTDLVRSIEGVALQLPPQLVTKEYCRFAVFADA